MSRRKEEKNKPSLIAYYVKENDDEKGFWTRIGAAWDHKDGKGLTLALDLVPIGDGRIVLREENQDDPYYKYWKRHQCNRHSPNQNISADRGDDKSCFCRHSDKHEWRKSVFE